MAEVIKKRGFFWWFNEPEAPTNSQETSVPGLLTITEGGQIDLETDGALCQKDEYQDWSKPQTLPEQRRIVGRLPSSGKYVLLEGLERTDFSLPDETPQQQRFNAQLCVQRGTPFPVNYGRDGFIELRIELTGFEDWLGLESIVVDRENSEGNEVHVRVSYKEWQLEYPTPGGILSIDSITTGAPIFTIWKHPAAEAQFRQYYYLVFRPDRPRDVNSLRYTYTKLEELLALLIGKYIRFAPPILVSKEDPCDAWNTFYFYRDAQSSRPVKRYSMWVSFESVRGIFDELFKNWLAGSESCGAGYYLYVSSLRNPQHYAEDRFVNLVWGVEALHRKRFAEPETSDRVINERERVERVLGFLPSDSEDRRWLSRKLKYAHEPSLEARILECLRKLPFTFGPGEVEKFAKACADRRNDISHAGGPRKNMDYESFHVEISQLAEALDHLFHVLLLHQIGVDPTVIFAIMTNSLVSERIRTTLADVGLSIKSVA